MRGYEARRIAANIAKLPELLSRPLDKVKNAKPPAVIVGRWLVLLSFVCLVIVVLTHVAETIHVFPGMGWGLPDSPGHYLDLVSAVLGSILLIAGVIISSNRRRPR